MSVSVDVTESSVSVEVFSVGDVTSAAIDAVVSMPVTEAAIDSLRGARGPAGPTGATGDPGQSVAVHWSSSPPLPGQGNVGDIWVVV